MLEEEDNAQLVVEVRIYAIDPGPTTSGMVLFDSISSRVVWADGEMANEEVLTRVRRFSAMDQSAIACECIEAMYAHVGKETVQTIRFTGRIEEAATPLGVVHMLSPQEVKKRLCGTAAAKDPAVRQALIDRLGAPGTKKNPGPTYGVSKHAWRALAVAVAVTIEN